MQGSGLRNTDVHKRLSEWWILADKVLDEALKNGPVFLVQELYMIQNDVPVAVEEVPEKIWGEIKGGSPGL